MGLLEFDLSSTEHSSVSKSLPNETLIEYKKLRKTDK